METRINGKTVKGFDVSLVVLTKPHFYPEFFVTVKENGEFSYSDGFYNDFLSANSLYNHVIDSLENHDYLPCIASQHGIECHCVTCSC